jgi:hypothetical protein
MARCFVCGCESAILDEHHILPQFIGGKDTQTIKLCPTCHSGIHRQALAILSKSKKQLFNEDQLKKAAPLIKQIIQATVATKENKALKARSLITIEVEPELLLLLHLMKKDAGYTNLNEFIKHMLVREAKKKL